MIFDEGVVNSCRVCGNSNQDGEFESLLEPTTTEDCILSQSGRLYEELMEIQIDQETIDVYPQFLCQSCELQMKLFKKLRERAKKTLDALHHVENKADSTTAFHEEFLSDKEEEDDQAEVEKECIAEQPASSETELVLELNANKEDQEEAEVADDLDYIDVHFLDESEHESVNLELDKPSKQRQRKKVDNKKKLHKCCSCQQVFSSRKEYLQHRKEVHQNKYPCPECPKTLRTSYALHVHRKLHRGEPSFKCELCPRSFHQKVHLSYHMDKHNNVRRFKCELCGKAFLSKADLAIHNRTHTGDKRYICNICGKTKFTFSLVTPFTHSTIA